MLYTEYFELKLPDNTDDLLISDINANMITIDTKLKELEDRIAALEA